MKSLLLAACASIIIAFTSCGDNNRRHAPADAPRVKITRFDRDIAAYPQLDSTKRAQFRDRYAGVLMMTVGPDTITDKAVATYARGRGVTMFVPDIKERFTTQDSIENVLTDVCYHLSGKLPEMTWKEIYGGVSTYNQSILMTDTIMLVGLNHYLGEDYPAYAYFEPYQRVVKTERHLPYDITEAMIIGRYPYVENESSSLLNRMLYDGAITYILMTSLPGADLSEAMGYTREQTEWMMKNEGNVWRRIIEQGYLYSTDGSMASRLCRPAPASPAIHPDAPGAACRFIGYRIVDAYMQSHPDFEVAKLLSPEFYNSTSSLVDAGYSPR